jgi:hypothetical protein
MWHKQNFAFSAKASDIASKYFFYTMYVPASGDNPTTFEFTTTYKD